MRARGQLVRVGVLAVLGGFLATSAAFAQDPKQALPGMEKALWEAWSKGDTATFDKHMTENTVNVNAGGIEIGKKAALAELSSGACKVASYSVGDITVTMASDSTAILTYTANQDATCEGHKLPGKVNVSSVWVKQGGKWLAALYHESEAAGM
jgi:Domain of unknown function (DUF4440)